MQVETFECQETAAEPIEASEEAIGLIEELGLDGQKSLVCKQESGHEVRCPYREMTAEERFVYGVLCPKEYRLAVYKATPIPLRVLQVASHAKSLGIFDDLMVWDKEDVEVKDPVLVANIGESWSSARKVFILARWGEELEAFATLLRQAIDKKRQQFVESLENVKSQVDAQIGRARGMSSSTIVKMGANADCDLKLPFEWDR